MKQKKKCIPILSIKDAETIKDAAEQMRYSLGYIKEVRQYIQEKLVNPRRKLNLKMWDIDLIDELWISTLDLEELLRKHLKKRAAR